MASLSQHSYQVAFNDTGGATPNTTNRYTFTVAPYVNVDLGPPLYLETFDELAEGTLPAGWSVVNFTDYDTDPGRRSEQLPFRYLPELDGGQPQQHNQLVHRHTGRRLTS